MTVMSSEETLYWWSDRAASIAAVHLNSDPVSLSLQDASHHRELL